MTETADEYGSARSLGDVLHQLIERGGPPVASTAPLMVTPNGSEALFALRDGYTVHREPAPLRGRREHVFSDVRAFVEFVQRFEWKPGNLGEVYGHALGLAFRADWSDPTSDTATCEWAFTEAAQEWLGNVLLDRRRSESGAHAVPHTWEGSARELLQRLRRLRLADGAVAEEWIDRLSHVRVLEKEGLEERYGAGGEVLVRSKNSAIEGTESIPSALPVVIPLVQPHCAGGTAPMLNVSFMVEASVAGGLSLKLTLLRAREHVDAALKVLFFSQVAAELADGPAIGWGVPQWKTTPERLEGSREVE